MSATSFPTSVVKFVWGPDVFLRLNPSSSTRLHLHHAGQIYNLFAEDSVNRDRHVVARYVLLAVRMLLVTCVYFDRIALIFRLFMALSVPEVCK